MLNLRADVKYTRKEILKQIFIMNEQGQSTMSLERIAERMEISFLTVFNHVHALNSSGYIVITRGRGRTPNTYHITEKGLSKLNEL